ncbi:hypothetical protein DB811_01785 [Xanthomonas perforans]|uniref:Uncharacterized protein n=1 Tax=Xanthomonas perforans TaxID=442694 RepID=A0AAQ0YXS1_XANPE|nr:hypothetical protein Xcom_14485 [Xanthomonas axonopodis pv. commiphoreae]PPU90646.1 hypothetical protein XaclCFBP3371_03035 [Xanthomonas euvesicatoria pv. citrumelonis]PWH25030.1 hypothetical protein CDO09_05430 [Xanthomonas perforans]RXD36047.1 hypothetical protein DB854_11190 [Xanthomonas perforans]RXD42193.1 hypothetical protein DB761_14900 [Xanthomonas perforans]
MRGAACADRPLRRRCATRLVDDRSQAGGSASIRNAQQLRIAPPAQLSAWRVPSLIGRPERAWNRRCVHGNQTHRRPATFWQAPDGRFADPQTGAGLH